MGRGECSRCPVCCDMEGECGKVLLLDSIRQADSAHFVHNVLYTVQYRKHPIIVEVSSRMGGWETPVLTGA